MRKLASVRRVEKLIPIEKADAIELAVVDGWQVVIKKGEYKPGDLAVYFEIDSWIPSKLAPFLSKGKAPKLYKGVEGERLRTIKLRGEISQGLLLPLNELAPVIGQDVKEEDDVTEALGILKWEAEDLMENGGGKNLMRPKGNFPAFLRKTDQERIQNLFKKFSIMYENHDFEVTMKLDGSSCTVYRNGDVFGVCSRNQELKVDEDTTPFVLVGKRIIELLKTIDRNIALQGELMGPKIQKNREQLMDHEFFLFDIWDIDKQRHVSPQERRELAEKLNLKHCPVHSKSMKVFQEFKSVDDFLKFADKPSMKHKIVEGFVFKSNVNPDISFKVINNKFLLKCEI